MTTQNQFQHAEDEYFRLKGQLAAGRIAQEQFEAALKNLMIQDAQGRYWTIGGDSGKWYVHDGRTWVEAPAPTTDPSTAPTVLAAPKASRKSSPAVWITCGGCALVMLLGVVAIFFALSQGIVKISLGATSTPTLIPTPVPSPPTITPMPTSTSLPTNTPSPTSTLPPTATPTRLTAPIFGAVGCSAAYDEAANKPIDLRLDKIVASGTTHIYASWSYQVPDLAAYKYTWYHDSDMVFSDKLKVTDLSGTMWVGTWYTDRKLETGTWKFELRTLDDKLLLTDACIIQ